MTGTNSKLLMEIRSELLREGLSVRFRVGGRSMYPTIRNGELITVEPCAASEIRCGDIVFYRLRDGVLAHRVIRIESEASGAWRFTTRGDSYRSSDAPVKAGDILGRVIAV